MNIFFSKIRDGFGLGLGLILALSLFYAVFAFVEPSTSPSSDYVLNWNSPLNALHSDTNSRVSNVEESLGSVTANSGMYDNRIPANFNPPNDYTMICFKGGSTLNDQMDGGDSTNDGVNCEPEDIGFIIEVSERASATWSNAKQNCLQNGMRLSEPFEFKLACDNAGTFGLIGMTGNWEWASNFASPTFYSTTIYGTAVSVIGDGGCNFSVWSWVGTSGGGETSNGYRCVR